MMVVRRLSLALVLSLAPGMTLAQTVPMVGRGISGTAESWDTSAPTGPAPSASAPAAKPGFFSKLFKKSAPSAAPSETTKAPLPLPPMPPDARTKPNPAQAASPKASPPTPTDVSSGDVRTEFAKIEAAKAGLVLTDRAAAPITTGSIGTAGLDLPRVPVPKAKPWAKAAPAAVATAEKPIQEMPPVETAAIVKPVQPEAKPLPVVVIVPGPPPDAVDDFHVGSVAKREGPLPSLAKEATARKTLNDGTPPYQRVRALQLLQDKIATGSTDALQAERRMRAEMDATFPELDPSTWQDPRNATALVAYGLSGGFPEVVRRISKFDPPPAVDKRLLQGALAYLDGREKEASEALADIDPRSLDPSVGAHVAMAQAALAVKTDIAKAMLLLDTARLMSPGTLVEEAALRREVFMTGQSGDRLRFEALARQYLDRFRHSVYAGNFRYRFVAALTQSHYLEDAEKFTGLERMLENVEAGARREVYLAIARSAAFQAKPIGGALAAARAEALSERASPEALSARLYAAAAFAVMPGKANEASQALSGVDRRALPPSDRGLFDAVRVTVDLVLDATKAVESADLSKVAGEAIAKTEGMKKAEQAIDAANALLSNPKLETKS